MNHNTCTNRLQRDIEALRSIPNPPRDTRCPEQVAVETHLERTLSDYEPDAPDFGEVEFDASGMESILTGWHGEVSGRPYHAKLMAFSGSAQTAVYGIENDW